VAGGKGYVACGNAGLLILNLSPGGLSLAGQMPTGGLASGLSLVGTSACVANGANGWALVDVSNPAAPGLAQTFLAQGPVTAVAASGNSLTVANTANRAITLHASMPLTPVPLNTFQPLVRAMRLTATPTLLLTAEDEAGVAILGNNNDVDQDGLPDWWEQQIIAASQATNGSSAPSGTCGPMMISIRTA